MTLTFDVPDSVLQEIHLPPAVAQAEVTKEVALALYARGLLSLGKASEYSGMTRPEFESLLAQRRVERPCDVTELERDLAWAKGNSRPVAPRKNWSKLRRFTTCGLPPHSSLSTYPILNPVRSP